VEAKGEINISPQYSRDDYLNLNLSITSSSLDWETAVDIFKDRIQGRYLNQIDLLSCDINANGFAIMALNCLLIEALYQFEHGLKETKGSNKEKYAGYLKTMDAASFNTGTVAEDFYTNIRCGILHSAQAKAESRLSDRDGFVAIVENNVLVVSVDGLTNLVKNHFNNYAAKLLNPAENERRKNFIRKMGFVCRK
jgi:hypothetical protein